MNRRDQLRSVVTPAEGDAPTLRFALESMREYVSALPDSELEPFGEVLAALVAVVEQARRTSRAVESMG